MRYANPSVHVIANTVIDHGGLDEMLRALGAPEDWQTDASSDAEELTEVMGRLCYKSFGTEMNPNITRVREGNEGYVGNILSTKHGSVLEHSYATVGFIDVSPVLTHELVRHRVGTAFSQVSMRFVRLTEIGAYFPQAFTPEFLEQMFMAVRGEKAFQTQEAAHAHAQVVGDQLRSDFETVISYLENMQKSMAEWSLIDHLPDSFDLKKRFTSSMRRLAPYGLATSIGVTANHRAWRFMIQQRTHRSAEEEIRLAFGLLAPKLAKLAPSLYQDMSGVEVNGFMEYSFANQKV